ncbi:hydroxyproline O-galactosyltransferase HPGT1-like [Lycium ferocissimum]|uniref:hydroxyproline O-galactosyltransferase HPGT1-like n=1 Tax=Lycium ferocissimum TaxID=112874 RepID=UPI0028163397|nr:hydroxyproline O-galactosyltransferase HPGT1-like [Lycium ferocissimum]
MISLPGNNRRGKLQFRRNREKASQEGLISKHVLDNNESDSKKKVLAVLGVSTNFGNKKNKDAISKAWDACSLFLDFFSYFLSNAAKKKAN